VNIWDWVDEQREEALLSGNNRKIRLCWMHVEAYQLRETNPTKALQSYEEGSRLAHAMGESWWVMFYDEWRVTALLFFLRDYARGLDLAVQTMLEARKPQYAEFPALSSIRRNLVVAYVGRDAAGYEKEIREALALLHTEMSRDGEDRFLILGSKREFALEMNYLDEAEELSQRSLALADTARSRSNGVHHSVFNYSGLCEIAWRRGDWTALGQFAEAGVAAAYEADLKMEHVEFLMWSAFLARRSGNRLRGASLYRGATARVGRLKMPPDRAFFDGLSAYHELESEWAESLKARRWQLQTLVGTGRIAAEVRCRVRICRLLTTLGESCVVDKQVARECAVQLRDPSPYLRQLDEPG